MSQQPSSSVDDFINSPSIESKPVQERPDAGIEGLAPSKVELSPADTIKAKTAELSEEKGAEEARELEWKQRLEEAAAAAREGGAIEFVCLTDTVEFYRQKKENSGALDEFYLAEGEGAHVLPKKEGVRLEDRRMFFDHDITARGYAERGDGSEMAIPGGPIRRVRDYPRVLSDSLALNLQKTVREIDDYIKIIRDNEHLPPYYMGNRKEEDIESEVALLQEKKGMYAKQAEIILRNRLDAFGRAALQNGDSHILAAIDCFDRAGTITDKENLDAIQAVLETLRTSNPILHNRVVDELATIRSASLEKQKNA